MQTETEHEEMILQELRAFPQEAIPEVIHILKSVRKRHCRDSKDGGQRGSAKRPLWYLEG